MEKGMKRGRTPSLMSLSLSPTHGLPLPGGGGCGGFGLGGWWRREGIEGDEGREIKDHAEQMNDSIFGNDSDDDETEID
jgi:hypothetical protein